MAGHRPRRCWRSRRPEERGRPVSPLGRRRLGTYRAGARRADPHVRDQDRVDRTALTRSTTRGRDPFGRHPPAATVLPSTPYAPAIRTCKEGGRGHENHTRETLTGPRIGAVRRAHARRAVHARG